MAPTAARRLMWGKMLDTYFLRVLVIPTAVFLSAIFGAAYGSGREVMEFISSNGPSGGLVALSSLCVTYMVLLGLSFEIARLFKAYDYVGFFKVLLGRGWFLYEIVIVIGLLIAMSITVTVGGTVLEDHFGFAVWIGSLLIFVLVVGLNYYGRKVVEQSMMLSIAALFAVLAVLAVQLFDGYMDQIVERFATIDHQPGGILTGLQYAIANGGYLPILLYCAMGLHSRAEAFTAAVVAALVCVIPAAIFHFAFMLHFPEIVDERIPTYWMFTIVSTPLLLNIYVVVMFVLVAQTGVALMQGLIQRVDGWHLRHRGRAMSRLSHAGVAAVVVASSLALGTMGIIALILRGYSLMFASFIVVFVTPLLTYGVYLVYRGRSNR